ncbi:hypothetical protein NGB36_29010 [Streptomyces sp. RB6PN25]|uniref:Secreted protein n=1 Tax=Streptomyces humicola TaxID=2953240 RepID=A0ABT1Q3P3_9ACTN|nr:hypothetical protein [Streptomyces humicola]MCQ4084504.1 hypothetical protein [Streptomyces humicola]
MARIRTARALAAIAALPLAAALFTGTASADNGSFANHHSNSSINNTAQFASGWGASNQSNTASVNGAGFAPGFTHIDQSNVNIHFTRMW